MAAAGRTPTRTAATLQETLPVEEECSLESTGEGSGSTGDLRDPATSKGRGTRTRKR
jgi:hypothetical protein